MFDFGKFQQVAAAALGALILTAVSVGAAVGPARAIETAPIAHAQVQAADQAHV
jgi:hypothetical protein